VEDCAEVGETLMFPKVWTMSVPPGRGEAEEATSSWTSISEEVWERRWCI